MAVVAIKIRRTPNERGGRILAWLVHPASEHVKRARSHDVDDDGWHATYLIRSDLFQHGKMVDDRPVEAQAGHFLTSDELRRIITP